MIINLPFNFQIRIYASHLEKRTGICSVVYQEKDKHILLWDFDDIELEIIVSSLRTIQNFYVLPTILIVSSSANRHHAYCLTARTFREVIHILSATPEIDLDYLRMGMARGYYTLRISERKSDTFKLVYTLSSSIPNEVNPLDITTHDYLTMNKGGKK